MTEDTPDISAPVETSTKKTAPDGGPLSNARINQNRYPTVALVHPDHPDYVVKVNQHDVPEYEALGYKPADPSKVRAPRVQRKRPTFGTETEADLLTWTVARLKKLPEVAYIEGTPASEKKDLVRQILEVRSEFEEA